MESRQVKMLENQRPLYVKSRAELCGATRVPQKGSL